MNKELHELLQKLATEQPNPQTEEIDLVNSESIMNMIHTQDRVAVEAVNSVIPELAAFAEEAAIRWQSGGRIIYAGAGTSGRLGVLDAAELPPTFSVNPQKVIGLIAGGVESVVLSREGAEDLPRDATEAITKLGVSSADVVIGISASSRTPFAIAALEEAHKRNALTGFLVCNQPDCSLSWIDRIIIANTGSEAITGSTRMKAALAQKMMLTLFSTTVMVLSGKVYGNCMVDLKTTSAKLEERAVQLVMTLSGASYAQSVDALEECENNVKEAVLMLKYGMSQKKAQTCLHNYDGKLRAALEDIG